MLNLISRRALFRFELPVRHCGKTPRIDGNIQKWDERFRVPDLFELDEGDAHAAVWWSWDEHGFYAAFHVTGKRRPPVCDPKSWWKLDGIRLCLNTRPGRDVRRATRFCHLFYLLPAGGGRDGKQPVVGLHAMSHAKEPPPHVALDQVRVSAVVARNSYAIEAAFPAAAIHGWNPAEHPQIGVFYKVRDTEMGDQTLTVNDDLGWNVDPSTWAIGVLTPD